MLVLRFSPGQELAASNRDGLRPMRSTLELTERNLLLDTHSVRPRKVVGRGQAQRAEQTVECKNPVTPAGAG